MKINKFPLSYFFQICWGGHLISLFCLNRTPIANPAIRIQNNAKVMINLTTANFFLQIPLLGSLQRTILMKVCIHIQARPPKKAKRAPIQWIYWINLSSGVGVSSWWGFVLFLGIWKLPTRKSPKETPSPITKLMAFSLYNALEQNYKEILSSIPSNLNKLQGCNSGKI